MFSGVEQAAVEGHTEGGSSSVPMRQAFGRTRDSSPRQLPTDHDYDGGPCARSANIRVINRRLSRFDRRLFRPGANPEEVP